MSKQRRKILVDEFKMRFICDNGRVFIFKRPVVAYVYRDGTKREGYLYEYWCLELMMQGMDSVREWAYENFKHSLASSWDLTVLGIYGPPHPKMKSDVEYRKRMMLAVAEEVIGQTVEDALNRLRKLGCPYGMFHKAV